MADAYDTTCNMLGIREEDQEFILEHVLNADSSSGVCAGYSCQTSATATCQMPLQPNAGGTVNSCSGGSPGHVSLSECNAVSWDDEVASHGSKGKSVRHLHLLEPPRAHELPVEMPHHRDGGALRLLERCRLDDFVSFEIFCFCVLKAGAGA